MGIAGTAAKLLASLDLDTRPFEAGAKRAGAAMDRMGDRGYRIGARIGTGLNTAAKNLARIGVVAAGALTLAVKSGIQSLADLERANQQTGAVIESTGGKAGVTAQKVRELAEAQERLTTVDDKVVQAGENMLLTFTNIGSDVFPAATKAIVDMGVAMNGGSVEGLDLSKTAIQVGKALNDPIKGVTALRKVGVQLTEQQEKQIKKFIKSGDIMSAQKIILQELTTEFGKAGEAAGEGFGGDMRRFDDALEDSRMALATGFLPVIRKVADKLTTFLADPKVQQGIRDFGDTLAGAFDRLLEVGGKLPWAQIGDSLRIAGAGAKTLLDAFVNLPPWIQTAVLTGWGLNKLTGGALGGIVGELGKGLIKGVLGINAGVVNVKGAVVNGGGGVPGGAAAAGAAGTGISALGKVFLIGEAIGLVMAVNSVREAVQNGATVQAQGIHQTLTDSLAGPNSVQDLQTKLAGIDEGIRKLEADPLAVALVTGPALDELKAMRSEVVAELDQLNKPSSSKDIKTFGSDHNRPLRIYGKVEDQRGAVKWEKIADNTAKTSTKIAVADDRLEAIKAHAASQIPKLNAITQSVRDRGIAMANRIDATTRAVHAIPPAKQSVQVATNVKVNVTANSITRSVTQSALYTANHLSAVNKANNIGWT